MKPGFSGEEEELPLPIVVRPDLAGDGAIPFPEVLQKRFGRNAPQELTLLGNPELLNLPKTALLCSARCPGSKILSAYDQAARWREERRCIISGFHSPVERECLQILLRGTGPIILCVARSLPKRIPKEWRDPIKKKQLLIVSFSPASEARVTAGLAQRRNEYLAALADEVWFAHIAPGSATSAIANILDYWRVPYSTA